METKNQETTINFLNYPICFARPNRLIPDSAWLEHVPFGMFIVDYIRPKCIVELGAYAGVSYCSFCQSVKQLFIDAHCYAVDTWRGDEHGGYFGDEVLNDLRNHHDPLYGGFSRLIQSTFDEAVNYFPDHSIDLLHIDGYHTYEAVKHDFETWLPKVSSRGIVLFHDVNVRENNFGVWKFWEEVKKIYPHQEFYHQHGLGILCVAKEMPPSLQNFFSISEEEFQKIRDFFYILGSRFSFEEKTKMVMSALENTNNQVSQSLQRSQEENALLEQTRISHISQLEQRDQDILVLQSDINRKDQDILILQSDIRRKDQDVLELKNAVQLLEKEREGLIDQLNSQVEILSGSLKDEVSKNEALSNQITAIYSSRAGRLIKFLQKTRKFF
jgi:uncharacterized protein YbcI